MIPPEADSELQSGADREFVRAKYFIRDNFLQISQQERASELDLIQLFSCNLFHFTKWHISLTICTQIITIRIKISDDELN